MMHKVMNFLKHMMYKLALLSTAIQLMQAVDDIDLTTANIWMHANMIAGSRMDDELETPNLSTLSSKS